MLIIDYTTSFVEGRPVTIKPEDIQVELPREDDVSTVGPDEGSITGETALRSPFRYLAEMMVTMGPMIDVYNGANHGNLPLDRVVLGTRSKVAALYDELPLDMMWNAAKYVHSMLSATVFRTHSLQRHYRASQGPSYLFLHLWNHMTQVSKLLLA